MFATPEKVQDSLIGYVQSHSDIKFNRKSNTIFRADAINPSLVRIISGGSLNNAPFPAGYVGKGMLAAAAISRTPNEAAPTVHDILGAMLLVGNVAGTEAPTTDILLVVANNFSARLNFGLAMEMARAQFGFNVEMIVLEDDCGGPEELMGKGWEGRLGSTGIVLLLKMAGAMAENGYSLAEICNFCNEVKDKGMIATINASFEINAEVISKIRIGKGISGEQEAEVLPADDNFEKIVGAMVKKLQMKIPRHSRVLVMINNFGKLSESIFGLFCSHLMKKIERGFDIQSVIAGNIFTCFDQEAVSVTLLSLEKNNTLDLISHPIKVPSNLPFNNDRQFKPPPVESPIINFDLETLPFSDHCYQVHHSEAGIAATKKALVGISEFLIKCEKILNGIDTEFGDADIGTSLKIASSAILAAINGDRINLTWPAVMLHDIVNILIKNGTGRFIQLVSIFLEAASRAFIQDVVIYGLKSDISEVGQLQLWLVGVELGNAAIEKIFRVKEGDRSVFDVLKAGEWSLKKVIDEL